MQNTNLKNVSNLLLATFFISTSGVLGKYIAIPAEAIVWFRSVFAAIFIYFFCRFTKVDLTIKVKKDWIPWLSSKKHIVYSYIFEQHPSLIRS